MFFPEVQPTSDPSGTQQRDCSLWVMGEGTRRRVNSVSNRWQ
jgi:hypothetical protein